VSDGAEDKGKEEEEEEEDEPREWDLHFDKLAGVEEEGVEEGEGSGVREASEEAVVLLCKPSPPPPPPPPTAPRVEETHSEMVEGCEMAGVGDMVAEELVEEEIEEVRLVEKLE